jgi:hypothetical protein
MSQDGPCISDEQLRNFEKTFSAVFINGHPRGSVMVRIANIESQQANQDEKLDEIKKGIDDLPKKLFIWLSILTLFFGLVTFLAPSLRKAMDLSQAPTRDLSQDAKIPPLAR